MPHVIFYQIYGVKVRISILSLLMVASYMDISMPTYILSQTLLLICQDVIVTTSTYIIMASLSQSRLIRKNSGVRISATRVGYIDKAYCTRHLSMETAFEACIMPVLSVYLDVHFN